MAETGDTYRPRVVVTADDAGLRADWDRAVFQAHEAGVVTAMSVVTNGPTYPEARARLLGAPGLDTGVHLNAVHGRPLSPPLEVQTLVDDQGRFCGSIHRFLARYLLFRLDKGHLAREWERQVQRALDDGLRPTHLNSHYHVHLLPGFFDIAVALARRFGIRWVRLADEPPWSLTGGALHPIPLVKVSALWLVSRRYRPRLSRAGLGHGVSSIGAGFSGNLGPSEWTELMRHLGAQTTEIVCHPGQSHKEHSALASKRLLRELKRRAILCRFRDLAVAP